MFCLAQKVAAYVAAHIFAIEVDGLGRTEAALKRIGDAVAIRAGGNHAAA